MRREFFLRCFFIGISILTVPGCGSDEVLPVVSDTVPFSGKVKLDGKPMAGGIIRFTATSGNSPFVIGFIDQEGAYSMKTSLGTVEKPGAPPGKYLVTFSRQMQADGTAQDPLVPAEIPGVESLPARYTSIDRTQLVVDVSAAVGSMNFELASR